MHVTFGERTTAVIVKGIDPHVAGKLIRIESFLLDGSMRDLDRAGDAEPILVGRELQRTLHLYRGAKVELSVGTRPGVVFRVAGVFYVGNDVIDGQLILAPFAALQRALDRGDVAMGVELALSNIERSAEIAQRLGEALGGPPFQVLDWRALNTQ